MGRKKSSRPAQARCAGCGTEFAVSRHGRIPKYCPACRRRRCVQAQEEKRRAASQAKKAARVAQRLAAPAAKPKPAPEKAQQPKRETLRETVRRLCRENARREARGEKPLTYGQWELERWMAQRRGKK